MTISMMKQNMACSFVIPLYTNVHGASSQEMRGVWESVNRWEVRYTTFKPVDTASAKSGKCQEREHIQCVHHEKRMRVWIHAVRIGK